MGSQRGRPIDLEGIFFCGDRGFESRSLQRGVINEPCPAEESRKTSLIKASVGIRHRGHRDHRAAYAPMPDADPYHSHTGDEDQSQITGGLRPRYRRTARVSVATRCRRRMSHSGGFWKSYGGTRVRCVLEPLSEHRLLLAAGHGSPYRGRGQNPYPEGPGGGARDWSIGWSICATSAKWTKRSPSIICG